MSHLSVLNSPNINPPHEALTRPPPPPPPFSLSPRPYSKSPAPNLTVIPLAPPVHPGEGHAPCRGPGAVPRPVQELHNGEAPLATRPSASRVANQTEDMDTDGEIDVDNCDDREWLGGGRGKKKKVDRSGNHVT